MNKSETLISAVWSHLKAQSDAAARYFVYTAEHGYVLCSRKEFKPRDFPVGIPFKLVGVYTPTVEYRDLSDDIRYSLRPLS